MRSRIVPPHVPDRLKSEVKRSVEPVKKEERGKGVCLYVTGENGQRCGNPVDNNGHVIPESSVLDELKDPRSEKVLELRWGVARWEHYYVTSSATNPITPNDPDEFEPQSVVTGNACVGRFACKCKNADHDGEFSLTDVKHLDFNDPRVPVLSMYRACLYEADLCRLGKRLMEQHKQEALRHPRNEVRVWWNKLRASLQGRMQWSEATSERLGKIWYRRDTHGKLDADAVSVRVLNFRSSLKFAACVFSYGKYIIVTVSPLGGDRHKMGVLHLSDDTDAVTEATERLSRLACDSENSTNYGVDVLKDLMTYGAGSVAASPESYHGLPVEERRTINQIVADASGAGIIAHSFGSQRPVPKGAIRTYQRGRRRR